MFWHHPYFQVTQGVTLQRQCLHPLPPQRDSFHEAVLPPSSESSSGVHREDKEKSITELYRLQYFQLDKLLSTV